MTSQRLLLAAALLAATDSRAGAQTQVDLRTQSKSVDFSNAQSTKPSKTGTTLPATCNAGETYFKTSAPAGQNLYGCTATNTWSLLGGSSLPSTTGATDRVLSNNGTVADWRPIGGDISGPPQTLTVLGLRGRTVANVAPANNQVLGWVAANSDWEPVNQSGAGTNATQIQSRNVAATAPSNSQVLGWVAANNDWEPVSQSGGGGTSAFSGLQDCQVVRTSATVLTVNAPCNARVGNVVTQFAAGATLTQSGGVSGVVRIGIDSTANPPTLKIFNNGLSIACAGMNCNNAAGSTFDPDTIQLATWNSSSGSWDLNGGTDLRPIVGTMRIVSGIGLLDVTSAGTKAISVDASVVPTYLTATATIAFSSIAIGACATDQTFALSGAATGDSVAPGWPPALESGLLGSMRVSAANTIAVRLCNFSGGVLTPASATFRATIVRSF